MKQMCKLLTLLGGLSGGQLSVFCGGDAEATEEEVHSPQIGDLARPRGRSGGAPRWPQAAYHAGGSPEAHIPEDGTLMFNVEGLSPAF